MNTATNSEQPKAAPAFQNRVTLVGYLGREPEQLEGRAILSLATKASWKPKDSDQYQERTDWHRIVVWGKQAEAVRDLAKGSYVLVEGELRTNQYQRELQVNGGDIVEIAMKAYEIRAHTVRKLVARTKATEPLAAAA
jgi:single stranded DNA-binding protein